MARLIAVLAILSLMLTRAPATAAPPPPNDLVKVAFVHYRVTPDAIAGADAAARTADCPNPSTCSDYRWQRQKWSGAITYKVNASDSGVSANSTIDAISGAVDVWTHATTGLNVTGDTTTEACSTAGTDPTGRSNLICWRDLNSTNVIAVTYVWYLRTTKEIVHADMIFNNGTGFTWSYTNPGSNCYTYTSCNGTASTGDYDIRDLATHEFGHFFAFLTDLYTARDAQLTMYGYGEQDELQKDSLAKGDCLAITKAYGGSCP